MISNINNINVNDLVQYLINNGWTEDTNFISKNIRKFDSRHEDDGEIDLFSVIIPKKNSISDYNQRIYETVKLISELEEIEMSTVVDDIFNVNIDKMDIRLISEDFSDGTISLNVANNIIPFTREVVISSACVEENPRARYNKPTKKALEYADIFRFGQTKVGSYIISIEADLGKSEDNETPFERKIINRMQQSIYQIVSNDDYDIKEYYSKGLNGNICEAIAKLKDIKTDITIEYSFKKSKTIEENTSIPSKIVMNKGVFEKAEKLAMKFKEIQENEEVHINGKIKNIDLYNVDQGIKSGYVIVNFSYMDERKTRNVKIYVEGDNFDVACDAFKDHKDIHIEGILDKSARTWCIDDVKSFDICGE